MSTLHATIALIDQSGEVSADELSAVAAALQTQVNRDLSQFWSVTATITTLPNKPGPVPITIWPIYIVKKLPPGEGGYHWITGRNQPYSVVEFGDGWTVAASHECCEFLIDPSGNRMQDAPEILLNGTTQTLGTKTVSYLVEIADPCENLGYVINGVAVSDFITPNFYKVGTSGLQYSFTGNIKTPMQILFGGYISWMDDATNDMMQITWLDPNSNPTITNLGSDASLASLKEHVDRKTGTIAKISASSTHPAVVQAKAMAHP